MKKIEVEVNRKNKFRKIVTQKRIQQSFPEMIES